MSDVVVPVRQSEVVCRATTVNELVVEQTFTIKHPETEAPMTVALRALQLLKANGGIFIPTEDGVEFCFISQLKAPIRFEVKSVVLVQAI